MAKFIIRRLAIFPFVLLLANFLGFAYAYYLGPVQAARNPYGFIGGELQPIIPQYIQYLKNALQFDLGTMPQGELITTAVMRACLVSFGLLALALIASILVGLPLGLNAVRGNPPRVSTWLTAIVSVGLASPSYYIGVLLIAVSVVYLIWGPGSGTLVPFQGYGWDMHLVLPTLALAFLPTVKIAQITSGMLVEEMGKQYVVAARSFGHTQRSIHNRIAFRNILAAVVITIAASLRLMVAELIIIERLFGWPGFGRLLASTIVLEPSGGTFLLPPLVAAMLTVLAAFFLMTDLVAGVLVRFFDPRQVEA